MNMMGRTGSGERPDQVVTVMPGNKVTATCRLYRTDMPVREGDGTGAR
jgi:hypothetical protein